MCVCDPIESNNAIRITTTHPEEAELIISVDGDSTNDVRGGPISTREATLLPNMSFHLRRRRGIENHEPFRINLPVTVRD